MKEEVIAGTFSVDTIVVWASVSKYKGEWTSKEGREREKICKKEKETIPNAF